MTLYKMKLTFTLILSLFVNLIFSQNDTIVNSKETDSIPTSNGSDSLTLHEDNKLKIGGFIELDHFNYFKQDEDKINSRNQVILELIADKKISSNWDFHSDVELRGDQADADRNRIFIREAYVDYFSKKFDIRMGNQIITWGTADAINPTNNINPIDYSDLLDTDGERRGVFSVNTKYYFSNFTLQGIWVPIYNSSILPKQNSRWFPELDNHVLLPNGTSIPLSYVFDSTKLPTNGLSSSQFAFKLATVANGWDLSASYYYGFDDLPSYKKQINFDPTYTSATVTVLPEIHKLQVYGFDFSKAIGKYGLRGEASYFRTEDPEGKIDYIDDAFFWYVAGIDRNFSNVVGDNNLFVLVQWVGQYIDIRNQELVFGAD